MPETEMVKEGEKSELWNLGRKLEGEEGMLAKMAAMEAISGAETQ